MSLSAFFSDTNSVAELSEQGMAVPQKLQCHAIVQCQSTAEILKGAALGCPALKFDIEIAAVESIYLRYQKSPSPDLIIIEVNPYEDIVSAMQRLADVCQPKTQVLILGERDEVGLYRTLISMGVMDYMLKPYSESAIRASMQTIVSGMDVDNVSRNKCRNMVVTSTDSGLGCSFVCAQLGYILSEDIGMHLALIDMDVIGGNLDLHLGVNQSPDFANVFAHNVADHSELDKTLLERISSRLNDRMRLFKSLSQKLSDSTVLNIETQKNIRFQLAQHFSALLWDLPSFLVPTELAREQFKTADEIIVVTSSSVSNLRSIHRFIQLFQEINVLHKVRWIVNQPYGRSYTNMLPDDVMQMAGIQQGRWCGLPYEKKASRAVDLGEPIRRGAIHKSLHQFACSWLGFDKSQLSNTKPYFHQLKNILKKEKTPFSKPIKGRSKRVRA